MENTKRQSRGRSRLVLPMILGFAAGSLAPCLDSFKPEQPQITRATYEDFQVRCDKYSDRTVVMMQDNKGIVRIHGQDNDNDGKVNFAEPVMGYRGTGLDLEVLQAGYDAVPIRNK